MNNHDESLEINVLIITRHVLLRHANKVPRTQTTTLVWSVSQQGDVLILFCGGDDDDVSVLLLLLQGRGCIT